MAATRYDVAIRLGKAACAMSGAALGEKIDVSKSALSRFEGLSRFPTDEMMARIADGLGLDLDVLRQLAQDPDTLGDAEAAALLRVLLRTARERVPGSETTA